MFEFQHRQLAHIVRLVIWTCLIATVVILIIPEVSAAGEPSLEFNQSSYEINDTVEVKLLNSGLNRSNIYLNIWSSSDQLKITTGERVNSANRYEVNYPVADRNNDYQIDKNDFDVGQSVHNFEIDTVFRTGNNQYELNFSPNLQPQILNIGYSHGHTVELGKDGNGTYTGSIRLSNNKSRNSILYVEENDNITINFPLEPGSNLNISETTVIKSGNNKSNTTLNSSNNTSSPTQTPFKNESTNNNPLNESTPTPEPTPSADDSPDDAGDTTPPEIGAAVGFYDALTEDRKPMLTVIAGVSEPIRGLGETPPEAAMARLHGDGVRLDAELLDDGSTGDRIRLVTTDPPAEATELVVEGVIDPRGNRAIPVRRPVQMAATVGSSSDESVSYIPGDPLAIVAAAGHIRRITATTDTGWPLSEQSVHGPVVVLQTVRWPDDAPVTLELETVDGHTRLQADPVSPDFSMLHGQVSSPGGPITAHIEGPPTVRQLNVEVIDAAGRSVQQTTRWSSPSGRTALTIPLEPADGPVTLSVTDPTREGPPAQTTMEVPADGQAIRDISLPESVTSGALLPIEVLLDAGATAGLQITTDETVLAHLRLTDADGDGTVTARLNTQTLLADSGGEPQMMLTAEGADTAEMTMLGAADQLPAVAIAGIDTTQRAQTRLRPASPRVQIERAPASSGGPFSETRVAIPGEPLRLRVTDPALVGLRHARSGELGAPIAGPLPDAYSPQVELSPDAGSANVSLDPRWSEGGYTAQLEVPSSARALNITLISESESIRVVEPAVLQTDPLVTNLAPQTAVEVHTGTGTHRSQVATDGIIPIDGATTPSRITVPGSPIELSVPTSSPTPTDAPPASEGQAVIEAVKAQLVAAPGMPRLPAGITTTQALRYTGAVIVVLGVVWVGLHLQRQRNA